VKVLKTVCQPCSTEEDHWTAGLHAEHGLLLSECSHGGHATEDGAAHCGDDLLADWLQRHPEDEYRPA